MGALLFRALLKPKVPELSRGTWPRVLSACQGLVDCKYKPSHAVRAWAGGRRGEQGRESREV